MRKFLISLLMMSVVILSSCSKEIAAAKNPQEKMFYQILEVALYSVFTTVILEYLIGWLNITLKRWQELGIFVVMIIIFTYLEFFGGAPVLPSM